MERSELKSPLHPKGQWQTSHRQTGGSCVAAWFISTIRPSPCSSTMRRARRGSKMADQAHKLTGWMFRGVLIPRQQQSLCSWSLFLCVLRSEASALFLPPSFTVILQSLSWNERHVHVLQMNHCLVQIPRNTQFSVHMMRLNMYPGVRPSQMYWLHVWKQHYSGPDPQPVTETSIQVHLIQPVLDEHTMSSMFDTWTSFTLRCLVLYEALTRYITSRSVHQIPITVSWCWDVSFVIEARVQFSFFFQIIITAYGCRRYLLK